MCGNSIFEGVFWHKKKVSPKGNLLFIVSECASYHSIPKRSETVEIFTLSFVEYVFVVSS